MSDGLPELAPDKTAYVGFFASVSAQTLRDFIELVNHMPPETERLYVMLSTGGGSVSEGFVLYNFLRALPMKVVMHNVGSVDSIGNVIYMASDTRYVTPTGTFLIHRVKSTTQNENAEISYIHEKLSTVMTEEQKIKYIFCNRSRLPSQDFDRLFEKGELKNADFALEHGIAHERRDLDLPRVRIHLVQEDA